MWFAALIVLVGVLAILISATLQVDDWSRDLSTNRAATSGDASDETLRTLKLPATIEQVREAINHFVEQRTNWSLSKTTVDDENDDENDNENQVLVLLVRTSRLFRFADDVKVTLQPCLEGTLVDAVSQSRVGKGDLGQNPRNLRKLLEALRTAF